MKILIKVTKEILEQSKMCGSQITNCAVACAVRDLFPNAAVGHSGIWLTYKFGDNLNDVPMDITWDKYGPVYNFIRLFDAASPVNRPFLPEFSFEIDVPSEIIEEIGIGEVYRILSESKTLELVNPVGA